MPPKKNNNKFGFEGGYALMKEIQKVIAFRAYEDVNALGESMRIQDLHDRVFEKYHGVVGGGGNNGHGRLGLAEKFMKGLEMFEGIYDEEVDHVTGKLERVLKPILHCKPGSRIIADEDTRLKGINMLVLTANRYTDKSLLTGRTIWDMGKQVEENGKKVLAIVSRSKYKSMSLPSGEQWEDYLKFCRYKMYQLSKEEKKRKASRTTTSSSASFTAGDDSATDYDNLDSPAAGAAVSSPGGDDADDGCRNDDDNPDEEAEHIKNWESHWSFPGYMAWALWGHICMPGLDTEYKAQQFLPGDEDDDDNNNKVGGDNNGNNRKKKKGRKMSRKDKANHNGESLRGTTTTTLDGSTSNGTNSIREQLLAEHLKQTREFYATYKEQQGMTEQLIAIINKKIDEANMKIMEVSSLVMQRPSCFENPQEHLNWYPFKVYYENTKKRDDALMELDILYNEIECKKMQEEKERDEQKKNEEQERTRNHQVGGVTTSSSICSNNVPSQVIAGRPTTPGSPANGTTDSNDNSGVLDDVAAV